MINRDRDAVEWVCDTCDETEIVEPVKGKTAFLEAWDELRRAGWRSFQIEGMWQHKCPDCIKEKRNVRT